MKFTDHFRGATQMVLVVALALALIGYAQAEGQVMYVCTESDKLTVREEPNLHAPWVFRLDRGEAVTVYDTRGGWAYVEWVGQYGWCWAEYLADKPPVDGLPDGWLDGWLEVEED